MSETVSCKSLHLEYRLWIAELNYSITLIRIFHDRLEELQKDMPDNAVLSAIPGLSAKLSDSRAVIDELTHRMQIEKMNLARISRESRVINVRIPLPDNYSANRNDFYSFRTSFETLKAELLNLEVSSA